MMDEKYLQTVFWLKTLQKKFDLRVVYNDWSDKLNYPFHACVIEFKYQNHHLESVGIGKNKLESIFIASMEFIERLIYLEEKLDSTNGLAVHTSLESSIENSLKELIERDSYMYHILTMQLPSQSNLSSQLSESLLRSYKNCKLLNYSLPSYQVRYEGELKDYNIVLSLLDGKDYEKPFGLILGLGSSHNLQLAFEKSVEEVLSTLGHNLIDPLRLEEFDTYIQIGKLETFHHHQLGLDLEYSKSFFNRLTPIENEDRGEHIVEVVELRIPNFIKPPFELFATLAKSETCQEIFWGHTTEKKINSKRFNASDRLKIKENSKFPHPFA